MSVCLHTGQPRRPQRGVATLTVVMVLFFVVSLVAAYAGRNSIFEQRTSANQYRSTQALEAAEAGLEWAIAMLNSSRITDACTSSANTGDPSFRQRYLVQDASTGLVTPASYAGGELWPSCVLNGATRVCHCPTNSAPAVVTPAGSDIYPAFRVRFRVFSAAGGTTPDRPGMVAIDVNGCTRNDNQCLNFPSQPVSGDGRATISAVLALKGGVTTMPSAAITARGAVNFGGNALTVVNSDLKGSGFTVQSGGVFNQTGVNLIVAPGSPTSQSVVDSDASLTALSADRMFASVFGMWPGTLKLQPASVQMDCASGCSTATVRAMAALNPNRVLWLNGALSLDGGGDLGSPTEPVLLVVNGDVTFGAAVRVYGMIYSRAVTTTTSGAGEIQGAWVAEGALVGTGAPTVVYNADVLNRLRLLYGSMVKVPGSWKDWQ